MGDENKRDRIKTLEHFFGDLAEKISHESKATMAIGTMLADLVDELGNMISGTMEKANVLAKDALRLVDEMQTAVENRDNDLWDRVSREAYLLQGRISAYMEIATELQQLGSRVGRRSLETKH